MTAGLVNFDETQGWRGATSKLDITGDWGVKLADVKSLSDISPWRMAVVLETSDQSARIGFQPGRELGGAVAKERQTGNITLDGVRWARAASGPTRSRTPTAVSQVLSPGDIIYADPLIAKDGSLVEGQFRLRQLPEVSGAMVVMDPWTGRVLAMVGGFSFDQSQFNRATQAYRQPGSSFKPFVYLAAFAAAETGDDGALTPATILDDSPLELVSGGKVWRPENYDGTFRGSVTARDALEHSLNVPTVRAALGVGLKRVIATARQCGIDEALEPLPSVALGAQEVTPIELARAYGALATLGLRADPRILQEVVSQDGKRLEKNAPRIEQAIPPQVAYLVDDVLRGVLTEGTAASSGALGFRGNAAGKTGTTDDTRDAWFVGFTPEILSLVWVGYDDNAKTGLTGAAGALPIWVDLMMHVRHRWEGSEFPEPPGVERAEIDPESGGIAVAGCPQRREEVFLAGTEPPTCPLHEGAFRRWWHNLFHPDKKRAI
jgi:penicillin-binding protein 1A